ncbi:DUF748 domain-containing protein [Celerinatantimonas sp. YJH-8]|uniref:DUF748 domain-containing protein n=1 Tax=Celerinatantimonas sp. YJH-8 TaxID=3228714 RepID=UPI0038CB2894
MIRATFAKAFHRFKQCPRYQRWLSYLIIAYGVYALILGGLVPVIAESMAPSRVLQYTGRHLKIDHIRINPFLLRVRINAAALENPQQNANFIAFKQLELEFNFWHSLFTWTPYLDHITLIDPKIQIARTSPQTFNFSDIIERINAVTPAPSSSTPATDAPIPALQINQITIQNGHLQLADQVTGAHVSYQTIHLGVSQFNTQALSLTPQQPQKIAQTNHYQLTFNGSNLGAFKLAGQFQLAPLQVQGDIQLAQLQLAPFWPLIADKFAIQLTQGIVNLSSHFQLENANQHFQFKTRQGQFSLSQLQFASDQQPKAGLDQLQIADIAVDSAISQVTIDHMYLKHLWANAHLDQQGVDLVQLFTPNIPAASSSQTASESSSATKPSPQWHVALGKFSLTQAEANVIDDQIGHQVYWNITPVSLSTGPIDTHFTAPIDYQLALSMAAQTGQFAKNSAGSFSSQGQIDVNQQRLSGKLQLDQLQLAQFQPYLAPYLNLYLTQGQLSGQGQLDADSYGEVRFHGDATLADLLIGDHQKQPLLRWQQMQIHDLAYDQKKQLLQINDIDLKKPYAKVTIHADRSSNISDLVKTAATPPSKPASNDKTLSHPTTTASHAKAQPASSATALKVNIKQIRIHDGSAYFADQSITPNFASGIESLNGQISRLSSQPGSTAKVDLKGSIDQYAPVTLKGKINPLLDPPYLDLDLNFKNVELVSVNPYSGTYAGYFIDKGQLSLALNYQLDHNQLMGKNHIVINQLQLGKASDSKEALNLPLKLAIALLQDRHGVIDLGLQVSGDLNNPDFSYASIVWGALKNILTKAVMSPFSLLAKLVGSDDQLNQVSFPAGSLVIERDQQQRLDKLAQALDDRPQLKLSLKGGINQVSDRIALKEQQLHQLLLQQSGLKQLPVDLSASRFPASGPLADALQHLFITQIEGDISAEKKQIQTQWNTQNPNKALPDDQLITRLHIAMYNRLLNAQSVKPIQLLQLAQDRAKMVKNYLVNQAKITPERVFLLNSRNQMLTQNSEVQMTLSAN